MSITNLSSHTATLYSGYCKMPVLWKGMFQELVQFRETDSATIPESYSEIKNTKRLGKVAEDLFSTWVTTQTALDIIVENLQIIHQKQTLGELDVLLFDHEIQKQLHVELITKFYLYNPAHDCNTIEAWIGPNRNDSLKKKVEKLVQKQLPLLYHPHTKEHIEKYDINLTNVIQQVCFKAWLFVPLNFSETLHTFNTECIAGNYLTFDSFKDIHNPKCTYFCPNKQDWLRFPETQFEWHSLNKVLPIIESFMEKQQSIMVWVQYEGSYKRYIVTPYSSF